MGRRRFSNGMGVTRGVKRRVRKGSKEFTDNGMEGNCNGR